MRYLLLALLVLGCSSIFQPPDIPAGSGGSVSTGGSAATGGSAGEAGAGGHPARCQFVETRVAAERSEREVDPKVINGSEADLAQYHGLCALRNQNGSARCTAELVSDSWILAAGHCEPDPGNVVLCGCADVRSPECQRRIVETGYVHELYKDWREGHDLALAKVSAPFLGLKPVVLSDVSIPGEHAFVAGWGRTCTSCSTSPVLLEAELTLLDNRTCSLYYPGSITDSMVCALGAGSDAAPGDSGGFLGQYIDGTLSAVAVVSWGRRCTAADPGQDTSKTCVGVYASLAGEVDGIYACTGTN